MVKYFTTCQQECTLSWKLFKRTFIKYSDDRKRHMTSVERYLCRNLIALKFISVFFRSGLVPNKRFH